MGSQQTFLDVIEGHFALVCLLGAIALSMATAYTVRRLWRDEIAGWEAMGFIVFPIATVVFWLVFAASLLNLGMGMFGLLLAAAATVAVGGWIWLCRSRGWE